MQYTSNAESEAREQRNNELNVKKVILLLIMEPSAKKCWKGDTAIISIIILDQVLS